MGKTCKNCYQDINRPIENAEERLKMATSRELGKNIYYAILDKRFRSIELCNWCYSLLRIYKYSLKSHKIYTEQEKQEVFDKLNNQK